MLCGQRGYPEAPPALQHQKRLHSRDKTEWRRCIRYVTSNATQRFHAAEQRPRRVDICAVIGCLSSIVEKEARDSLFRPPTPQRRPDFIFRHAAACPANGKASRRRAADRGKICGRRRHLCAESSVKGASAPAERRIAEISRKKVYRGMPKAVSTAYAVDYNHTRHSSSEERAAAQPLVAGGVATRGINAARVPPPQRSNA